MANPLAILQQSLGLVPPEELVDPTQPSVTPSMTVSSRLEDEPVPTAIPTNYDTLRRSEDVRENAPERKGMFGIRGTLRDVLGTLGDAFLVGGGGETAFRPWKEREMQADAAADFTSSPLAAIERLSAAGFTKEASKLWDDYQQNQYRQGTLQSLQDNRKDQQADRKFTNVGQATSQLQQILAQAKTPAQRRRLAEIYGPLYASRAGVSVEELGLSEGMTDRDLDDFAHGAMTVNQTINFPLAERRVEIAQQNANTAEDRAESARISATRPRNAPNPTAASIVNPIINKALRGEQLSPIELETLDRAGWEIPKQGRTKGTRAAPAGAPSSGAAPKGFTVRRKK